MHAQCIAVASVTRSAGLLACPATCTRRCQLHNSFSRAGHPDVQRVVDEEADLGCKSTPELACDAVTPGTLSAGVLGRFEELAHLLCTCSSAASQRDLLKCSLEFLSCSATFEFSARKYKCRWFDDARRASSNHVVAALRGRTAWTGEGL
jgi:hypothetical protein